MAIDNGKLFDSGVQTANRFMDAQVRKLVRVLASGFLDEAYYQRLDAKGNMTGNYINSLGAAAYDSQSPFAFYTPNAIRPLRGKLSAGDVFPAGTERWDSGTQSKTFTAKADTDGATEPDRIYTVLSQDEPQTKYGMKLADGVEYAVDTGLDQIRQIHGSAGAIAHGIILANF